MKKIIYVAVAFLLLVGVKSEASSYKIDEALVDQMFNEAEEISLTDNSTLTTLNLTSSIKEANGDKSVGGFLLRAYFCGFIALHRTYMGTGGKSLLLYYLCLGFVPVSTIDFCWVLFKGQEALDKYADNPKWMVW